MSKDIIYDNDSIKEEGKWNYIGACLYMLLKLWNEVKVVLEGDFT